MGVCVLIAKGLQSFTNRKRKRERKQSHDLTLTHFCFSGNLKIAKMSPSLAIFYSCGNSKPWSGIQTVSSLPSLAPALYLPLQNKTGSNLPIKTVLESLLIFLGALLCVGRGKHLRPALGDQGDQCSSLYQS